MNINKSFFKWCGILASVLTLAVATNSCTVDDRMMVELVELGALNKDYVVNAEAGDTIVKVYSNLEYRIKPVEDVDWARLSVESNVGDSDFSIEYDFNEGFPRMAKFLVYNDVDSRCDTIYFKQKGLIEPTLMMPNTALISTGSGGEQVAEIVTNIDMDDMEISIVYPEGESEEWIKDINISEGFIAKSSDIASSSLVVNTNPNLDAERPRTATIMILYVDDWGVEHPLNINVTQKNANEGIGRELTFDQVRAEYGDLDGIKVEDYVCIKGIVISDKSSGNAGENPQVTFQSIDYSGAKKTVYIQSLDGTRGFRVETVSEGDNIFEQYSQVEIQLRGSVVYYEENPERYIIKEVTSSMVTQNNAGDASDVVAKEMYMGELTPEDIYTWVSLKDCEFPIRKGALTPFNEGYT